MKQILALLTFCLPALCGWGNIESSEYSFYVHKMDPVMLSALGVPIQSGSKVLAIVNATPKPGTAPAKEYKVTLRFIGIDSKTYRQTVSAISTKDGGLIRASFEVDALDVLSVDVERENPLIIQEAQTTMPEFIPAWSGVAVAPYFIGTQKYEWNTILPSSGGYDIGYAVRVFNKEYPIRKFHYEDGAWCNVWADASGIHYEACKEGQ